MGFSRTTFIFKKTFKALNLQLASNFQFENTFEDQRVSCPLDVILSKTRCLRDAADQTSSADSQHYRHHQSQPDENHDEAAVE